MSRLSYRWQMKLATIDCIQPSNLMAMLDFFRMIGTMARHVCLSPRARVIVVILILDRRQAEHARQKREIGPVFLIAQANALERFLDREEHANFIFSFCTGLRTELINSLRPSVF